VVISRSLKSFAKRVLKINGFFFDKHPVIRKTAILNNKNHNRDSLCRFVFATRLLPVTSIPIVQLRCVRTVPISAFKRMARNTSRFVLVAYLPC
jgi:hypothetical protein